MSELTINLMIFLVATACVRGGLSQLEQKNRKEAS
jgi:hypothetical protein